MSRHTRFQQTIISSSKRHKRLGFGTLGRYDGWFPKIGENNKKKCEKFLLRIDNERIFIEKTIYLQQQRIVAPAIRYCCTATRQVVVLLYTVTLFSVLFFPSAISLYVFSSSSNMSAVSEWDNEYARLARVASQMRTTGILTQPSDVRSLQLGLQRLESTLNSLPLQSAEVQRRRRLIQHLQQTSVAPAAGATDSVAIGSGSATAQQSKMTMAMRQQDDMIDQLAVGVGRLKNQSAAIGEEAAMHVNLMNDMDTNLDAAYNSLEDQTRRASSLRGDQSLWRLQLIVAGLFILLILEIFFGLTP